MLENLTDMEKFIKPLQATDSLDVLTITPPADVFYHFERYMTNHWELLREATSALYAENPDFEFAAIYYGSFETEADAENFRKMHESEFRVGVHTISNRGVTLLGPFKENRQKLTFYNKNTEVLKMMMESAESDHKLGVDILKKRVYNKKAQNIIEEGPTDPNLETYINSANNLKDCGVRKALTREEEKELQRKIMERDQQQVPRVGHSYDSLRGRLPAVELLPRSRSIRLLRHHNGIIGGAIGIPA